FLSVTIFPSCHFFTSPFYSFFFFFLIIPRPPRSTLFPYTTLFRSQVAYREKLTKAATVDYQHKKQTGGTGQYAKVKIVAEPLPPDRKSTRLNSSHLVISYAVFCLKKKKKKKKKK